MTSWKQDLTSKKKIINYSDKINWTCHESQLYNYQQKNYRQSGANTPRIVIMGRDLEPRRCEEQKAF